MKKEEMDKILRNLLRAGNIVTVKFDKMPEIRKELDKFIPSVQIEVLKSDFDTVSFRAL